MKRTGWLIVALLAGSVAPAQAGRDVLREQSSKTVAPTGLRSVRVENRHGDVYATPSADGQIKVTALKTVRSSSRTESRRMARDLRVEVVPVVPGSGELVVRVRYPSQRSIRIGFWDLFNDFQFPSSEVRIDVEIPPGIALAVRSTSGDTRTEGLTNEQQIDATSGDVRIFEATGPVRIGTTSGDIEARGVSRLRLRTVSGDMELSSLRGALDAHSTSGDMTVREAADSVVLGTVTGDMEVTDAARGLRANTTSGDIVVRRARGRVNVSASSGNIEVGMAAVGAASISTVSGDIRLSLDRRVAARLDLQTSNGALQMDAPIQVVSMSRRRVEGRLHQGTAPIILRSSSGDIHVRTGDQGS